MRAGGHTYEKDGAVWLRSSDLGDDKDRVLVRSDGTPTYIAGDLGYIVSSSSAASTSPCTSSARDHHGYIGRLKAGAAALGYDPDRIDVQLYQFVKIVEGGRAVSASKRRGTVLMLDELLDAIGVDAARYALVQRSHDQVIELDLDLWAAQNAENPVYYCQYAHARIAAILRNARDDRGRPGAGLDAGAARGRAGEAARGVPGRRGRGGRAARAAPDRRLRTGDGEGLPPVLQAVPRARRGARRRAQPAGAVPRDRAL